MCVALGCTCPPCCAVPTQIDGGLTFTEPTAMLVGNVEGKENVSANSHAFWVAELGLAGGHGWPRRVAANRVRCG